MRVKIDFDHEIDFVIQEHLDNGIKVEDYIKASVRYFNTVLKLERAGDVRIGCGDKSRFSQYNTVISPEDQLKRVIRGEEDPR